MLWTNVLTIYFRHLYKVYVLSGIWLLYLNENVWGSSECSLFQVQWIQSYHWIQLRYTKYKFFPFLFHCPFSYGIMISVNRWRIKCFFLLNVVLTHIKEYKTVNIYLFYFVKQSDCIRFYQGKFMSSHVNIILKSNEGKQIWQWMGLKMRLYSNSN